MSRPSQPLYHHTQRRVLFLSRSFVIMIPYPISQIAFPPPPHVGGGGGHYTCLFAPLEISISLLSSRQLQILTMRGIFTMLFSNVEKRGGSSSPEPRL